MKRFHSLLLAVLLSIAALLPAHADYVARDGNNNLITFYAGVLGGGQILQRQNTVDATGTPWSSSNPFPITCISGCASSGPGSDVNLVGINGLAPSAAHPLWVAPGTGAVFPISATALPLPAGASTAAGNATGFASIVTRLGTPMQNTGGSVQVVGSLPAFASPPTVNQGTSPWVVSCTNCSSGAGGTSEADLSSFTAGSSDFTPVGGFFQTTATSNPLTTGKWGSFQVTAQRALFTNLRNSSGVELGTSGAPLRVDPTGSTTQPVSVQGTPTVNAAQSGAWSVGVSGSVAVTGTFWPYTLGQKAMTASVPVAIASDQSALPVTGTFWPATQPISAAALPLPSGASTSAKQPAFGTAGTASADVLTVQGAASMTPIAVSFNSPPTVSVTQGTSPWVVSNGGTFPVQAAQSGAWNITNISGTVSLPTGAATAANQATIISALGSPFQAGGSIGNTAFGISGTLPAFASPPTVVLSAETTKVIGTVNQGTSPWVVSASSLPLPALAATSTKQSDGSQKTQIVDGSGNVIASTSNNLNVQCANCSGSGASAVDEATFTAGSDVFAPIGGFFQTTATANPLTNGQQGFAQMTAQRALFANLRNSSGTEVGTSGAPLRIDPTGGTAQPVTGTFWQATQPISGTVTANAGTNLNTSLLALETGGNLASLVTQIGAVTASPTANTVNDRLKTINTTLGTPFQAGGSIGNTSFGISGTLPAFAAIPTFKIDQTTPGTTNGVQVNAALPAGSNTIGAVTQGSTPWNVAGAATSGTTKAGAPVQIGGVFNTTQPTVTTGQVVEVQSTARGAQIVATGVDTFNATINAALPAGSALIGKVGIDQTTPGTTNAITNPDARPSSGNITAQDVVTSTATGANNGQAIYTGTPTAGSAVANTTVGTGAVHFQVTGTWTGTVQFEASIDGGTTWAGLSCLVSQSAFNPVGVASATSGPAIVECPAGGSTSVRARGTSAWTGTAVVVTTFSQLPSTVKSFPITPASTMYKLIAANSNNSTNLKTTPGSVTGVQVYNNSSTIAYLKLYDKASAPTCGTDTPKKVIMIPASTSGAGSNVDLPLSTYFGIGIGICVVTGIADNDNTSVAASAYAINVDYR